MIPCEGFSRGSRLLKTADFRRVYNSRIYLKKDFLSVSTAPNDLGRTRLGVGISARAVKLAARRNRLKRLTREVFRRNLPNLKKGIDLVVGVKRDPGTGITYKNIEELLLELAKRAAITA